MAHNEVTQDCFHVSKPMMNLKTAAAGVICLSGFAHVQAPKQKVTNAQSWYLTIEVKQGTAQTTVRQTLKPFLGPNEKTIARPDETEWRPRIYTLVFDSQEKGDKAVAALKGKPWVESWRLSTYLFGLFGEDPRDREDMARYRFQMRARNGKFDRDAYFKAVEHQKHMGEKPAKKGP